MRVTGATLKFRKRDCQKQSRQVREDNPDKHELWINHGNRSLRDSVLTEGCLKESTLRNLADNGSPQVQFLIAQRRVLSSSLRAEFRDRDSEFLRAGAVSVCRDPAILENMSRDPSEFVRTQVASNRHTGFDTVQKLMLDPSWEVRLGLAHPYAQRRVLDILAQDIHPKVSLRARRSLRILDSYRVSGIP